MVGKQAIVQEAIVRNFKRIKSELKLAHINNNYLGNGN